MLFTTRFHSNRGAFVTGRFTARVGDATAHAASISATHAVRRLTREATGRERVRDHVVARGG